MNKVWAGRPHRLSNRTCVDDEEEDDAAKEDEEAEEVFRSVVTKYGPQTMSL